MVVNFSDKYSYEQISEFDKYEVSECNKICIKFDTAEYHLVHFAIYTLICFENH